MKSFCSCFILLFALHQTAWSQTDRLADSKDLIEKNIEQFGEAEWCVCGLLPPYNPFSYSSNFMPTDLERRSKDFPTPLFEIIELGTAAIPVLLRNLEDEKPTKIPKCYTHVCDHRTIRTSDSSDLNDIIKAIHEPEYMTRGEVCYWLLGCITNRRFVICKHMTDQEFDSAVERDLEQLKQVSRSKKRDFNELLFEMLVDDLSDPEHRVGAIKRLGFYYPDESADYLLDVLSRLDREACQKPRSRAKEILEALRKCKSRSLQAAISDFETTLTIEKLVQSIPRIKLRYQRYLGLEYRSSQGRSYDAIDLLSAEKNSEIATLNRIVDFGPRALPELFDHLDSEESTQLSIATVHGCDRECASFPKNTNNLDAIIDLIQGNNPANQVMMNQGDVCYWLIGQIMNRHFDMCSSLPSNHKDRTISDLGLVDDSGRQLVANYQDIVFESLVADLDTQEYEISVEGALRRLSLYFPQRAESVLIDKLQELDPERGQFENTADARTLAEIRRCQNWKVRDAVNKILDDVHRN